MAPLTALRVVLGTGLLTVLVTVLVAWALPRMQGHLGMLWRVLSLLLAATLTVTSFALVVNRAMGYVSEPSDLITMIWGSEEGPVVVEAPTTPPVTPAPVRTPRQSGDLPPDLAGRPNDPAWKASFQPGEEGVLTTTWNSPDAAYGGRVDVWLPRGYQPNDGKTYNVILFLHGFPGSPGGVAGALDLKNQMQAAIDSGKLPPTIFVIPTLNTGGAEPNCVDVAGQAKVETWVVQDMPIMLRSTFPNLSPKRAGWVLSGISSGAYCAVRQVYAHPDTFAGAFAFNGYDGPELGALHLAAPKVREENTLSVMAAQKRPEKLFLYLAGTKPDADSVTVIKRMLKTHYKGDTIKGVIHDTGGHNWGQWRLDLGPALQWWGDVFHKTGAK